MSSKANQNFISSFAVLEEVLKTKANEKERCAAWRQQSLIVKYLEKKLDSDFMQRHWLNYCFPIEQIQESCKYINDALGNNENHADIQFPSIENMNIPHVATTLNDMFSEVGIENYQQPNGEICKVLETKKNTNIENLCKPRNTMENFLQGHVESRNKQPLPFCSAREVLAAQTLKQQNHISDVIISHQQGKKPIKTMQMPEVGFNFAATKKSLGSLCRLTNVTRKNFVSPIPKRSITPDADAKCPENNMNTEDPLIMSHPALINVDPKMVELINNEIIHKFKPVEWSEIAGLDYAKSIIKEAIVYPLLRPDIFTGIRRPPKGILLFGPPGTGKTLIGKCIASQSSSTFFSISSASLTSKWMGEGEKMVRALFAVAVARQPSVIFIDEIDSLLSQRSENENDGTRRLKTEFLVRLDGAATSDDDRVLIVGATNRPQELDEAVRRRFVKRLYVPLPDANARSEILTNLLKTVENNLNISQIKEISELTEGYSGADIDSLCREASMEPLRSLATEDIITFDKENLRHVNVSDFYSALKRIRPSVAQSDLSQYVEWNKKYGSMF